MDYLTIFTVFVFGLIVGSFLNVVILRWNTGMSIAKGRSRCFSCGKNLEWHELIPLVSFLIQRGSCRKCSAKISWQYPLVEFGGGLAFILAYVLSDSPVVFILTAALLSIYIIVIAYDSRHKIVPDFFSYSAGLVSLGLIGADWAATGSVDPLRVIAGPALFSFFWAFWYFSKGKWMGLGDGKLALSVGWALGLSQGVYALVMSFWIGTIISLGIMAFQKIKNGKSTLGLKSEIPFGPFLIAGFIIQAILSHLTL